MALSEYEKQILAEMEQHLRQQDPDLADTMASSLPEPEPEVSAQPAAPLSPRRIALGSILATVGLASVLIGVTIAVTLWTILLGVLGFAMMVFGVLYALSSDKKAQAPGSVKSHAPRSPRPTREEKEEQRRERWNNRGRRG
ncbi:DUF3040 domain-containing protein [Actinomyces minihominis]|uniref:DUF3040 domain-containing protein n=1 Tax=Actinomyces minihominis TaxID=2002838 RepID=UPI000C06BE68|nr:DUF3040 domain-containing protein [Actinomyces minihominis]